MLSIFKSKNAVPAATLHNTKSVLDKNTIYVIEKTLFLDDSDIQAAFATDLIFKQDLSEITNDKITQIQKDVKEKNYKVKDINKIKKADYFLKDCTFSIIPFITDKTPRQCIYLGSSQGQGKTYTTCTYMLKYLELYPKNNVYIISMHDPKDDPSYNRLFENKKLADRIKYMPPYKLLSPLEKDELPNALVVFDDCDSSLTLDRKLLEKEPMFSDLSPDKFIKECLAFESLTKKVIISSGKSIVDLSRKYGTSMIWITHALKDRSTISISNSSDLIVFPYANESEIVKFFVSRTNLTENQVQYMMKNKHKYKYQLLYYQRGSNFFYYNNHIGIINFKVRKTEFEQDEY